MSMSKRKLKEITDSGENENNAHPDELPQNDSFRFSFMTSLQNICFARFCTMFWVKSEVQKKIIKSFLINDCPDVWRKEVFEEIYDCVRSKMSELLLPKTIFRSLSEVVPHVGALIFRWISISHVTIFERSMSPTCSAAHLVRFISWTVRGRIDCTKTASNIIIYSDLSNDLKYKFACTYCVRDKVLALAPRIINQSFLDQLDKFSFPMLYYWTVRAVRRDSVMRRKYRRFLKENKRDVTLNVEMIQLFLSKESRVNTYENETAFQYMWNALGIRGDREKPENLDSIIAKVRHGEFALTVLSSLDYKTQQFYFPVISFTLLNYMFNDWLWADSFLPTALYLVNTIEHGFYESTLEIITNKLKTINEEENKKIYNKYKDMLKQLVEIRPPSRLRARVN